MGRTYEAIDERVATWITGQPLFFVATAPRADDGHINCSPKGNRGEFAVIGERTVAYIDQTGSGVETIGPFCSTKTSSPAWRRTSLTPAEWASARSSS